MDSASIRRAAIAAALLASPAACNAVSGIEGLAFDLGSGGGGGGARPDDPGTLGFVGHIGGDGAQAVRAAAVGPTGDLVLGGSFEGTIDLGGGPIQSAGGADVFLARLGPWGNHLWSRRFGSRSGMTQAVHDLALAADGAIVAVGVFDGEIGFGGDALAAEGGSNVDVFVAKLDAAGDHVWSKRFGDGTNQYAAGVAVGPDGGVVVVGAFEGTVDFGGGPLTSAGDVDAFVVKLDAAGDHVWSKRFGAAGPQYARDVAFDTAGRAVVVGDFEGSVDLGGGGLASAGDRDVFVVALDAAGDHAWSLRFGDTKRQLGKSVAADPRGGVWIASDFRGAIDFGGGPLASLGDLDVAIASLDAGGAHLFSARFGDDQPQSEPRVVVDAAGEVTLSATFAGVVDLGGGVLAAGEGLGLFVAKLDATGAHRWSRAWQGAGVLDGLALAASPDRRIVVGGQFTGSADFGRGAVKATQGSDAFVAIVGP